MPRGAGYETESHLEPDRKVMVNRSSAFKLTIAVAALVLVLWVSGSPIQSLWMTPVIIFAVWIGVQLGLRYRRRHHPA